MIIAPSQVTQATYFPESRAGFKRVRSLRIWVGAPQFLVSTNSTNVEITSIAFREIAGTVASSAG